MLAKQFFNTWLSEMEQVGHHGAQVGPDHDNISEDGCSNVGWRLREAHCADHLALGEFGKQPICRDDLI